MANDVWELIAEVEAARVRVVAGVAGISGADGDWKPDADTWSIAENVEHLVLAEYSGINRMWRAVESLKQGAASREAANKGLSIEAIIERTWKPRELAPPMAAPQFGGPLAYWVASLWACQPLLAALGRELEGRDLEAVIFPHFLCGPMDARQRISFLRFHMDRHVEQIERTRRNLPSALRLAAKSPV